MRKGLCLVFCKMVGPGEWDTRCGIGLPDIHKSSAA